MKAEVTVVMPVYNAANYVADAIKSILTQTYRDFIFYIIDDGSTDNSRQIIEEYALSDARIVVFHQPNKGLIATLNDYCAKVETKYIARMDADDVALPTRLEKQVRFLKENLSIDILGTAVKYMDESLEHILEQVQFPLTHATILWKMLSTSGFCHPTVMMRKRTFDKVGGFSPGATHVEDYEFFIRAGKVSCLANLGEVLLLYRKQPNSVSHTYFEEQQRNHLRLSESFIRGHNLSYIDESCVKFLKYHTLSGSANPNRIFSFLRELYRKFLEHHPMIKQERWFIREDLIKNLSILALTYKNIDLLKGIWLYLKVVAMKPSILFFNLKNRK